MMDRENCSRKVRIDVRQIKPISSLTLHNQLMTKKQIKHQTNIPSSYEFKREISQYATLLLQNACCYEPFCRFFFVCKNFPPISLDGCRISIFMMRNVCNFKMQGNAFSSGISEAGEGDSSDFSVTIIIAVAYRRHHTKINR